jgi:hypothetical protein
MLFYLYAFGILFVRFLVACPVRCVVHYLTGAASGSNSNLVCSIRNEYQVSSIENRFLLTFLQKYVKIPTSLPAGKRSTAPEGKISGPAGPSQNLLKFV